MRSVTLKIKMINDCICSNCLGDLTDRGITIKILRCVPMGFNCAHCLLRLDGETQICNQLLQDPLIITDKRFTVQFAKVGNGIISAMVINKNCRLSNLMSESRCFLELAIPNGNNEIIYHLLGADSDSINTFIFLAKEMGYRITPLGIYEKSEWGGLTFRQERALRLAFESGYYSIPSATTLDELADKLDCSKSTLNVLLRKAEGKIILDYINGTKKGKISD